ncbi:hypothetical protein [Lactococcus taiwanensis]|uniref:hypothetical protein n=1 Tax=Lactococcus taiwanensis TaxID=1151742 RepID=UPI0019641207|nr:hypothetical protein [Lactococcus taiwanensis]QRZ11888.1 hypothetical protein JVB21_04395 [Lactococcus taiwanensis]
MEEVLLDYLRIFHFKNNSDGIVYTDGKVYLKNEKVGAGALTPEIESFFEKHADSISSSKRIQNIRFKGPKVLFIDYFEKLFESYEMFDFNSKKIAKKFRSHLTNAKRKDFILILFDMMTSQGKALVILTMEAKDGLQLENDNFNVVTDLLPDSTAKLKKAAIIFENETLKFRDELEEGIKEDDLPVRHAIVIDSQMIENNINLSFANFLDSQIIADKPTAVAKILLEVFPQQVRPYLEEGITRGIIKDELKRMFSTRRVSNFKDVTESLIVKKLLSQDKIKQAKLDSTTLAKKIFASARRKNNSINMKFEAEVSRIPKKILVDKRGGKNINVSISEASIEDGYVCFKEEKNEYVIKVKRSAVDIKNKA